MASESPYSKITHMDFQGGRYKNKRGKYTVLLNQQKDCRTPRGEQFRPDPICVAVSRLLVVNNTQIVRCTAIVKR